MPTNEWKRDTPGISTYNLTEPHNSLMNETNRSLDIFYPKYFTTEDFFFFFIEKPGRVSPLGALACVTGVEHIESVQIPGVI